MAKPPRPTSAERRAAFERKRAQPEPTEMLRRAWHLDLIERLDGVIQEIAACDPHTFQTDALDKSLATLAAFVAKVRAH